MLPELDSLATDMTAAILREAPGYGRPDDDAHAAAVHHVARDAVHQFAARVADPAAPTEPMTRMFRDIGRVAAADGRGLDPLHSALRVGARVAWQRLREIAGQGGADAGALAGIGEAIFRYLDELTAASSAGYAEAKAEFTGDAERLRHRLLDLLVADPPAPAETIAGVARAVGWPLPRRVTVVALADGASGGRHPLPPLPAGLLAGLSRREPCLLIPDPDGPGRLRLLEAGLRHWPSAGPAGPADGVARGCVAALGPAVPLAQAGSSLRWARQVLALAQRGLARAAGGVVRCDDHLATLALLADTELAGLLSGRALAPLRQLRPEQADRLAETLLAWLECADNAETAARYLHVHPQTVRYRLRRVTELFGDRLRDPDARFALQAALRARQLAVRGNMGIPVT
jgi:PucR C-terminal helix-turn-helix domain